MDQHSYMKRLSFDEFFSKEQSELFIRDMFANPKVRFHGIPCLERYCTRVCPRFLHDIFHPPAMH
jgi:hypothetical protein